jgi:xylulokinase
MPLLFGIDLGTTGARAIVVDSNDGRVVSAATTEYPLRTPQPQWAEQDPDDWWIGVRSAASRAAHEARAARPAAEIAAVGLSGQMHGVVLVDRAGDAVGPSIIWCDGRSETECREITERVGSDRLIELTSNPALVGFSAGKLLWIRRHRPDQFARGAKFLLPKDYIRFKLTGAYASEVSDASGTLLFDVAHRRWSGEMLRALDLAPGLLPDVSESTEITGRVSVEAAAAMGLTAGTPVVGGGGDQAAGGVGNGIVRPGAVSSTIGSSGVVFAHCAAPTRDLLGRVHTFCHAVPGAWHVMGVTQAAGLSLRWVRDQLTGESERRAAEAAGTSVYDLLTEEAADVPPGSRGLVFLPYLMGERTPHLDPHARAVWFGLTAAHRRSDLVRSVIEGVAYSLRDCLEILIDMGVPVDEIRASGGGARSAVWRQVQADVFGREVVTVNASEGPAFGAALLAGVGVGVWRSVPEACDACIAVTTRVSPDAAARAAYDRGYATYRALYPRLAPLYREAAD